MTAKEKISALKKLLFGDHEPAPAPAPLPEEMPGTAYKLADGTEVMVDKLEVGGKVTVGDQPAPDGEHTLEDGTVLATSAGLITEVRKVAPVEDKLETKEQMYAALEKFAEGAGPDQQKLVVIVKALFENVFGWEIRHEQEKAAREQAIADYKSGFEEQKQKVETLEKVNKELFAIVEHIADTEIVPPAEPEVEWEKMTPLQKFRAQKQMFKQN